MKIALDVQPLISREKTGIGYLVQNILHELLQLGTGYHYNLNFFASPKFDDAAAELERDYGSKAHLQRCRFIPGRIYRLLSSFIPLPYSMIFRSHADITHFQNFLVPPGVQGRIIATIHDMVYKACPETMAAKTRSMMQLNMERSLKRTDHIVTISEFSKSEIIKYLHIPEETITVIHCGVDNSFYRPVTDHEKIASILSQYQIPSGYILYMGTLEPRKNLERLLEAYAQAHRAEKDLPPLVLAGSKGWGYDQVVQKIHTLNLEPNVIITGYIQDHHKVPLLSGAEFFVFPSLYEGFGLPPLEAMACGTPVIASSIPPCAEVLGDNALLVNPLSTGELAEAMLTLHKDTMLRQKYSKQGLMQAQSFTWSAAAQKQAKLYQSIA